MPSILDFIKYRYNFKMQDIENGDLWDIAPAAERVIWTTRRNTSQAGSLEVVLSEGIHPSDLMIRAGNMVRFGVDDTDYFYGKIHDADIIASGSDGVRFGFKAYNHLMLLQNAISIRRPAGITASDFFLMVMSQYSNYIQGLGGERINFAVREPSTSPLSEHIFMNESVHDILMQTMSSAHIAEPNQFIIKDNLGTIEWRELRALRTNHVLGDESYVRNYTYIVTINEQTYNIVRVVRDNVDIGMRDVWQRHDSSNVRRWWARQIIIDADTYMTDAQISEVIDLHLKAFNRPHRRKMQEAVGIPGIEAGSGIQTRIQRLTIDHGFWCEKVEHIYSSQPHIMNVEVKI